MNPLIRGADPDAVRRPPVYHVVAPAKGETMDVTILSEYVTAIECHWVVDPCTKKGRTRRCYRMEGECQHCGTARQEWFGFVAIYDHRARERRILRLGLSSAKELCRWVAPAKSLRGVRLLVSRPADRPTGALSYRRDESSREAADLQEHDMAQTLRILFGCATLPGELYSAKELREGDK